MQKRTIGVALAILILIGLGAWFYWRSSRVASMVDLVAGFEAAEKRGAHGFTIVDQKIGDEVKKGIVAEPPSRIIWNVTVPRDAWLRTYLAMQPETWDQEGDGALFRVGVSDGKRYEEFLAQHVNPQRRPEDRRWIPVDLDLSAYANQKVEVIFNTNHGPPRRKADDRNDKAVWGAPEIMSDSGIAAEVLRARAFSEVPPTLHKSSLVVPLIDLRQQYDSIRDDVLEAIARVCESQQFVLGSEVEALELELARYLSARQAVGVSSGTDALIVALMALGIGAGDEVITSTFSFFATAGSIARIGARPVFVDVDPATCNIDPGAIEAVIGPRTRAIMPVHLYGLSADLDPILEIAHRHGLPVVEDACQAIGAQNRGRFAGTLGIVGCFSFYPSKNLGAFGDGGLVVTDDSRLAEQIRSLREHGAESKYHHATIGGNFRLDALQAAVLRVKAPRLDQWIERRRVNAGRYVTLFAEAGLGAAVTLPIEPPGMFHTYHQFVVRVPERERLAAHLAARGIGTSVYYPVPLHRQACFAALGYPAGAFPHAERAAREVLALPVFPELTYEQQAYVVDGIADFVRGI